MDEADEPELHRRLASARKKYSLEQDALESVMDEAEALWGRWRPASDVGWKDSRRLRQQRRAEMSTGLTGRLPTSRSQTLSNSSRSSRVRPRMSCPPLGRTWSANSCLRRFISSIFSSTVPDTIIR